MVKLNQQFISCPFQVGQTVGTQVENMITNLITPGKEDRDKLSVGLQQSAFFNEFLGLSDYILDVEDVLNMHCGCLQLCVCVCVCVCVHAVKSNSP